MTNSTKSLLYAITAVIFWVVGGFLQAAFVTYPGLLLQGISVIIATFGLVYGVQTEQARKIFSIIGIIIAIVIYINVANTLVEMFIYQKDQALRNEKVSSISECENIGMILSGNKSLCIANVAINSHDIELCNLIDKNSQSRCRRLTVSQTAIDKNDVTACLQFNFEGNTYAVKSWLQKASCIETAASCNKNESLCDYLAGIPEYKDQIQECKQRIRSMAGIEGTGGQICNLEKSL